MKQDLLASDFDQTLSFNDSGMVLSDMLGIRGFTERAAGLARIHLVQQGGELAYLLLHDPEYRRVRREDLMKSAGASGLSRTWRCSPASSTRSAATGSRSTSSPPHQRR